MIYSRFTRTDESEDNFLANVRIAANKKNYVETSSTLRNADSDAVEEPIIKKSEQKKH
jgi:hypothetical protein